MFVDTLQQWFVLFAIMKLSLHLASVAENVLIS